MESEVEKRILVIELEMQRLQEAMQSLERVYKENEKKLSELEPRVGQKRKRWQS